MGAGKSKSYTNLKENDADSRLVNNVRHPKTIQVKDLSMVQEGGHDSYSMICDESGVSNTATPSRPLFPERKKTDIKTFVNTFTAEERAIIEQMLYRESRRGRSESQDRLARREEEIREKYIHQLEEMDAKRQALHDRRPLQASKPRKARRHRKV